MSPPRDELAWALRSDTRKNMVRFVRSSDLTSKHRFVLNDDDF